MAKSRDWTTTVFVFIGSAAALLAGFLLGFLAP